MLTKVFRIELAGGKDVEKDIVSISKAMSTMAAEVKTAKAELKTLNSGDVSQPLKEVTANIKETGEAAKQTATTWKEFVGQRMGQYMKELGSHAPAIKKIAEEWRIYKDSLKGTSSVATQIDHTTHAITQQETQLKSLAKEREKLEADAKRQAQVEKLLADIKLKEAQASKAQAQADESRVKSQIAQEKELDRLIDKEKKETDQLQKKKKELDAEPGSYNAIKKAAQELYAVLKNANSTSVVEAGGKTFNYDKAIAEYKRLSGAEQDFRRQFAKDQTLVGEYASGIVDAFKRLNIDDIIKDQVTGAKQQLGELEKKTQELTVAYRQAQKEGSQDLDKLQKEIHDNVVETEKLNKAVKEAEVQLKGIGGVGEQITGSINKGFKEMKNSIGQFVVGYIGFQAVLSGLQTSADNAKKLSDQTTDLEINMGKAKDGADGLISSLKGLDTRTNLSGLEEISNIALKAGATEQNLFGVSRGIDVVKTAFGKDFGEIEAGTETFVKLINIFYDDGQITEDRILKIGNSIRTLANETVASVPFINDFAGRMAGLRQVSNVTLPQIIGLGAGFEEFKQSAEVSSTVLVKVIPQMAKDIETFANIAGLTRAEFKKLLQDNPIEALLKVSQGLAAGKGDIEVFASTLKEAGIDSGRAVSIISTLGGKADIFRDRIARAGTAIQSTDAITDAFNRKNENLAATMDKISKKFADAAGSKGFQTTLLVLTTLVTFLLTHIPTLLVLGGLLALNWAKQNAQLVILNARILAYNIGIGASYVALGILTVAQTAYNAVLFIFNGAIGLATKALQYFNVTVKAGTGPLGIILTILGLLGTAAIGLSKAFGRSVDELSQHNLQLKISRDILVEANKAIADQKAKVEGYAAVVRDTTISEQTRLKALQDLIAINPEFSKALQGNKIDLSALNDVIKEYNANLLKKAQLEAAQALQTKEFNKLVGLQTLKSSLEVAKVQKTGFGDLSDEQRGAFSKISTSVGRTAFTSDLFNLSVSDKDFKEAFKNVDEQIKAQEKILAATTDVLKGAYDKAGQTIEDGNKKVVDATQSETVFQVFDRLVANNGTGSDFKALLKKIIEQKKTTSVLSKEYQDLLALEKKVRELIKPKSGSDHSRSPEKQKLDDALKAIDAHTTDLRNALDEQFAAGLVSERDYYSQVRDITIKGEQDKINTILDYQQKYKKALAKYNGDLAKDVSEAEKKQIQAKREANQKLFDIDNKQLEDSLQKEQGAALRDRDTSLLNPDLTNEEQLQIQLDYYDRLLLAQVVFNQKQIETENRYGIISKENAKNRKKEIENIKKGLEQSEADRPDARQKDIEKIHQEELSRIRRQTAERTIAILEGQESYIKKARALAKLESDSTKRTLQSDVDAAKAAFERAEKDRENGLISEEEYFKKLEDLKAKEAALYKVTTDEQASATQRLINALKELRDSFVENALGIKRYSKDADGERQRAQDAVAATQDSIKSTVNSAYQSYFKNREAQVEKDKQDHIDALDREKQRVLARAQSEKEKETIEKEYAKKQKAIEKQAAEEKRKIALKQASIDFAVAVIKTFAQFGFPIGLLPVAALTAAYLVQRAQINKQQFALGGTLKRRFGLGGNANEVPVNGGVFGGRSHSQGGTDFEFSGQKYNAEVEEMNIIRTRNTPKTGVYSITGNQKQIASALNSIGGGVSFASGAAVKKLATGGYLGSSLKAPYFSAGAYLNGGSVAGKADDDRIERLEAMTAQVLEAVYATDKKPVILNPGKVTDAQRKTKKDISTGTL